MTKDTFKNRFQKLEVPVSNTEIKDKVFSELDKTKDSNPIPIKRFPWKIISSAVLVSFGIILMVILKMGSNNNAAIDQQANIEAYENINKLENEKLNVNEEKLLSDNELIELKKNNSSSRIPTSQSKNIRNGATSAENNFAINKIKQSNSTSYIKDENLSSVKQIMNQKERKLSESELRKDPNIASETHKKVEVDLMNEQTNNVINSSNNTAAPTFAWSEKMRPENETLPSDNKETIIENERIINRLPICNECNNLLNANGLRQSTVLDSLNIKQGSEVKKNRNFSIGLSFGFNPYNGSHNSSKRINSLDQLLEIETSYFIINQYTGGLLFQHKLTGNFKLEHKLQFGLIYSEYDFKSTITATTIDTNNTGGLIEIKSSTHITDTHTRYSHDDFSFSYNPKLTWKYDFTDRFGVDLGAGVIVMYDVKDHVYHVDSFWTPEPARLLMGLNLGLRVQYDLSPAWSISTGISSSIFQSATHKVYHKDLNIIGYELNLFRNF